MEITRTRLAALVAGTAILAAAATAGFAPSAEPEPVKITKAQPLPQAVIIKTTMACATQELLDSLALIAAKGTEDQFSQAVDNAAVAGTCVHLRVGSSVAVVSSNPYYSEVVTHDGRRLVSFTRMMGTAE